MTTANIVKTTVFLADMSLFAEMNAVYAKYFEGDFPARSAIAVKALPKGALVEIESIAGKITAVILSIVGEEYIRPYSEYKF